MANHSIASANSDQGPNYMAVLNGLSCNSLIFLHFENGSVDFEPVMVKRCAGGMCNSDTVVVTVGSWKEICFFLLVTSIINQHFCATLATEGILFCLIRKSCYVALAKYTGLH